MIDKIVLPVGALLVKDFHVKLILDWRNLLISRNFPTGLLQRSAPFQKGEGPDVVCPRRPELTPSQALTMLLFRAPEGCRGQGGLLIGLNDGGRPPLST